MGEVIGTSVGGEKGSSLREAGSPERESRRNEQLAIQRAKERARIARWDLNIAIFLFAVLIIVIILLFQGIPIEIVAPIAVFSLGMVWLVGWRQGKQLYERFREEELAKLEFERTKQVEESVEEAVLRALRERWHKQ
jgi:Flp pilus assembly protein TadB